MNTSLSTEHGDVTDRSLLDGTALLNSTDGDACAGAGKFADGSCRRVWPFWLEVAAPLCCVVFFLLTLTIVYLRPFGSTGENESCKQQLNNKERTERDPSVSYRQTGKTSSDTEV